MHKSSRWWFAALAAFCCWHTSGCFRSIRSWDRCSGSDHTSCLDLLSCRPEAGSGVYTLSGKAGPFEAYCDMTLDGGGWTLVARSSTEHRVQGSFGWHYQRGSVDRDDEPYSLDAMATGLTFTEILLGIYTTGTEWGSQAYVITVPEDLVTGYEDRAVEVTPARQLFGDCSPARGSPSMLDFVGYTAQENNFFFRDNDRDEPYFGLNPDGFNTNYGVEEERCDGQDNDCDGEIDEGFELCDVAPSGDPCPACERGGMLHMEPGMLLVR